MGIKPFPIKYSWKNKLDRIKSAGIDTMCFIYQFEGNPLFGPLVFQLFSLLEEKKVKGFTSVLSLAEILSNRHLLAKKQIWQEAREKFWQTPNLEVVNIDGKICEAASIIRAKYSLPDAIQITTAVFNSADVFITNDEKLKKVKEVQVLLLKDYL